MQQHVHHRDLYPHLRGVKMDPRRLILVATGEHMDRDTLLAQLDFTRSRLLATLDSIEKSGQDLNKVMSYRPGPGRAHIGWQFMHCAATHDRYLNANIHKAPPKDEKLVSDFAGGSTPSDQNVPTAALIREKLTETFTPFREFIASMRDEDLAVKFVGRDGKERTLGEAIVLMAWHEAHHQGQIHLTWNIYKAANGVK
jgi:hypothetical protein